MNKTICPICGQDWMDVKMDVIIGDITDEPIPIEVVSYHCNYCKHDIIPLVTPQEIKEKK